MQVEHYSKERKEEVLQLVEELHREVLGEWVGLIDRSEVERVIEADESLGLEGNAFLMVVDGRCQGLLYGAVWPVRVNKKTFFQETFLWVREAYRSQSMRFLREVEEILRFRGIDLLVMTVLENYKSAGLKKLYERMGFRVMETHFVKELQNGIRGKSEPEQRVEQKEGVEGIGPLMPDHAEAELQGDDSVKG